MASIYSGLAFRVLTSAHAPKITNAIPIVRSAAGFTPSALMTPNRDASVESWFDDQLRRRVVDIGPAMESMTSKEIQDALEMANRLPDGSVTPLTQPAQFRQMSDFIESADDVLARAKRGRELLESNSINSTLMTIARGVPGGGASTRAQKWLADHPAVGEALEIDQSTPRSLYPLGDRTLVQVLLENGRRLEGITGRIIPNIVMTNSEIVPAFMETIRERWRGWATGELENTFLFNQVVLPRKYVSDMAAVEDDGEVKLYPAGHGDFPFLLGAYSFVQALHDSGIRYFLFSNADEYMWGPDPVMVSIAQDMADEGHPMLAIGVENTNNQFGGGFVEEGYLVETPRLPWSIVQAGKAPAALNTTFYLMNVPAMMERLEQFSSVPRILTVKEIPGRSGEKELIVGVDSHAGDIFTQIMAPSAFIWWPRNNFLGIKDAGFLVGDDPIDYLGGRTYRQFTQQAADKYPWIIAKLAQGDRSVATQLAENGYCYVDVNL